MARNDFWTRPSLTLEPNSQGLKQYQTSVHGSAISSRQDRKHPKCPLADEQVKEMCWRKTAKLYQIPEPQKPWDNKNCFQLKKKKRWDFPGPVAKTPRSQCRVPAPGNPSQCRVPDQGTKSHMLQLKIPHAATKVEDPVGGNQHPVQPNK